MDWTKTRTFLMLLDLEPTHPMYWEVGKVWATFFVLDRDENSGRELCLEWARRNHYRLEEEEQCEPVRTRPDRFPSAECERMERDLRRTGLAVALVGCPTGGELD
jgi:hypothetical protein